MRIDRYLRMRRAHKASSLSWLWIGRKGRLTVYGIEDVISTRARRAGIKAHPHLFRHAFAHHWLVQGGQETDLMRLAGWQSAQMLQRYGASAATARAMKAYRAGRSPVDNLGKGR
jgi:site-specific recombinase XerD